MKAQGNLSISKWDEKTYQQISDSMKLTEASVGFKLKGAIEGTASVEYLMAYTRFDAKDIHKSLASYVGFMHIEGNLNGKTGSFIVEDKGIFEGGAAKSALTIVNGSGTGELKGIKGSGTYYATQTANSFEIDYSL